MIKLLARVGLVRITEKGVRWPIHVAPWHMWKAVLRSGPFNDHYGWFGVFRNRPGVIRREKGRLLPRRWGVRILGLEIGDRG